jgi:hypothetical protein
MVLEIGVLRDWYTLKHNFIIFVLRYCNALRMYSDVFQIFMQKKEISTLPIDLSRAYYTYVILLTELKGRSLDIRYVWLTNK